MNYFFKFLLPQLYDYFKDETGFGDDIFKYYAELLDKNFKEEEMEEATEEAAEGEEAEHAEDAENPDNSENSAEENEK